MPYLIIVLVVLVLVCLCFRGSFSTSRGTVVDTVVLPDDEVNSHIWYRNEQGQLVYEQETCNGCMENYEATLRSKGVTVERVMLGRRSSGDLSW